MSLLTGLVHGVTYFHSETGTEGGRWAVQDDRYRHTAADIVDGLCPWDGRPNCPAADGRGEHWSYEGLHQLVDGDRLAILGDDGYPLWYGVIELHRYDLFTEDALGMWIHADQQGVDRTRWASMFMKEHRCILWPKTSVIPDRTGTPSG